MLTSAARTPWPPPLGGSKVQFTYDFTYDQAEQWVTNRSQLPTLVNGATRPRSTDQSHR